MDFGNITDTQGIDFELPKDPDWNKNILNPANAGATFIRYGWANWQLRELYPAFAKQTDWLGEYGRLFNAIEMNSGYFKIYDEKQIKKWLLQVNGNPGFIFCPKFYKSITYNSRLEDKKPMTDEILKSFAFYGDKLGPSLLQLPDNFSAARIGEVINYLNILPDGLEVFLELRHPDWFLPSNFDRICEALRHRKFGLVITDTPGRRDVLHMRLTAPKCYIRFVAGNTNNEARMHDWAKRIQYWFASGLEAAYFFVHPTEQHIPTLFNSLQATIGSLQ